MSLVHVNTLHWLPSVGKYQVSGLALIGDHPEFEPVVFDTDRPLADDCLYAFTRQGEVIPLLPSACWATARRVWHRRFTTRTALPRRWLC
jgi:hypothetical protein